MQSSVFFKKHRFTLLKSIYSHFKTVTKQTVVFFRPRLGKNWLSKNCSATWKSDLIWICMNPIVLPFLGSEVTGTLCKIPLRPSSSKRSECFVGNRFVSELSAVWFLYVQSATKITLYLTYIFLLYQLVLISESFFINI